MIRAVRSAEGWMIYAETLLELAAFHLTTGKRIESLRACDDGWLAELPHGGLFKTAPEEMPWDEVELRGGFSITALLRLGRFYRADIKKVEEELRELAKKGAR